VKWSKRAPEGDGAKTVADAGLDERLDDELRNLD
jgi:hypothetical protein